MAGEKVDATFAVNPDMVELLEKAGAEYGIPDTSKVLRVILDYVAADGDWDQIFGKIRCKRCMGGPLGRL